MCARDDIARPASSTTVLNRPLLIVPAVTNRLHAKLQVSSRARFGLRALAIVLLGLLNVGKMPSAIAQQPGVPTGPDVAGQRANRILVLEDGRMVEGELSQQAGGYRVTLPTGSFLIPFDRVNFTAVDRHDAYLKQLSTMPRSTASNHLRLAEWCLRYQMLDEAEAELLRAIELEPQRAEPRNMLRRLQEQLRPDEAAEAKELLVEHRQRTLLGDEPVQSLGGLSRETAADFVSKIQPLLLNKCGNAGCHGRVDSHKFRLTEINSGGFSHRVFAERNLAIITQQIDLDDPLASPLLTVSKGIHAGVLVYSGPGGEIQKNAVQEWVLRYTKERWAADEAAREKAERIAARKEKRRPRSSAVAAGNRLSRQAASASPAESSASAVEAAPSRTLPAEVPHPTGIGRQPMPQGPGPVTLPSQPTEFRKATESEIRSALKSPTADPFDPDTFNSRFGNKK